MIAASKKVIGKHTVEEYIYDWSTPPIVVYVDGIRVKGTFDQVVKRLKKEDDRT